jgi:hypothetical protein
MLPEGAMPPDWLTEVDDTDQCASFMHLHLGRGLHSSAFRLNLSTFRGMVCVYARDQWQETAQVEQNSGRG